MSDPMPFHHHASASQNQQEQQPQQQQQPQFGGSVGTPPDVWFNPDTQASELCPGGLPHPDGPAGVPHNGGASVALPELKQNTGVVRLKGVGAQGKGQAHSTPQRTQQEEGSRGAYASSPPPQHTMPHSNVYATPGGWHSPWQPPSTPLVGTWQLSSTKPLKRSPAAIKSGSPTLSSSYSGGTSIPPVSTVHKVC